MFGSSPAEAFREYRRLLHQALACVTDAVLVGEGHKPGEAPHPLVLNRNRQVVLPTREFGRSIAFRFFQLYSFAEEKHAHSNERWRVIVRQYVYSLEVPDSSTEIIAFHWHPETSEGAGGRIAARPHIHLGNEELTKVHLQHRQHVPAGWVPLSDVLEYAVGELGVMPKIAGYARALERVRKRLDDADWRP